MMSASSSSSSVILIDVNGTSDTQPGLPPPPPAQLIDNSFIQPQSIMPVETDDSEPYCLPELINELNIPLDSLCQEKLSEVQSSKMAHIDVLQLCRICLCNLKYECVYNVFDPDPTLAHDVFLRFKVRMSPNDEKSKLLCNKCYIRIAVWREELKKLATNQLIYNFICTKAQEDDSTPTVKTMNKSRNIEESTTSQMMNKPILTSNIRNSIEINTKKRRNYKNRKYHNSCIFCNHRTINEQELKSSSKLNVCTKHSMPYTCLVPNCELLFPNKGIFIAHYRYHLNLSRHTYLCSLCFGVLNCSRNVKKEEHVHQVLERLYTCCSNSFKTMGALVFHKFQKHRTKIIMSPLQCRNIYINRPASINKINDQLFTCLVPECDKVFNTCTNNLDHYREHADIPMDFHICSVCLCNYGEDSSTIMQCKHLNIIMCNNCQTTFSSLHDLAVHKLCVHDAVTLCGSDCRPGCACCSIIFEPTIILPKHHYQMCYNKNNYHSIKPILSNIDIPQINGVSQIYEDNRASVNNEDIRGTYLCKLCEGYYPNINLYVNHMTKMHKRIIQLKEHDIKLCPLCDKNYSLLHFTQHLEMCTKTMLISSKTGVLLGNYGCAYCKSVASDVSPHQFRRHFVYCKTFNSVLEGTQIYYKCAYCTFKSDNHLSCLDHANKFCIYFKLKMKYAMGPNEKLKVEKRLQLLLQKNVNAVDLSSMDIPTLVVNDGLSSNIVKQNAGCNSSNFNSIGTYNFFCNFCGKSFFDEFVFIHHLNGNGVQCRSKPLWYCTLCQSDYNSEEEYNEHLYIDEKNKNITLSNVGNEQPTLRRQLLEQEEIDETTSDDDCDDGSTIPLGVNIHNYKLFNLNDDSLSFIGFDDSYEAYNNKFIKIQCMVDEKPNVVEECMDRLLHFT